MAVAAAAVAVIVEAVGSGSLASSGIQMEEGAVLLVEVMVRIRDGRRQRQRDAGRRRDEGSRGDRGPGGDEGKGGVVVVTKVAVRQVVMMDRQRVFGLWIQLGWCTRRRQRMVAVQVMVWVVERILGRVDAVMGGEDGGRRSGWRGSR